ncbi:uncharacterized protein PRCAT00005715001 [Priceomyces carsonii]|uniref:uncharacterized protein n=1 Tax=Priceomyces carsonii TaxID=28549 RepID=UPI002EDADDBF|nr:unnamed protein product [Priceomyces carsonii]
MSGDSVGDEMETKPNEIEKSHYLSIHEKLELDENPDVTGKNISRAFIEDSRVKNSNLRKKFEDLDPTPEKLNLSEKTAIDSALIEHDNDIIRDLSHTGSNEGYEKRQSSTSVPVTAEAALGTVDSERNDQNSKITAYARLDFENFTFFVQTLQVVLGRKSNDDLVHGIHHSVDVHLSSKRAISRRHAKIFYNFGTQRFELSILGRNGAFVDNSFVEKGITIPLIDGTKIQIGDISFGFILPSSDLSDKRDSSDSILKPFNPSDAINLRSNIYNSKSPTSNIERENSLMQEIRGEEPGFNKDLDSDHSAQENKNSEDSLIDPQIQSLIHDHSNQFLSSDTEKVAEKRDASSHQDPFEVDMSVLDQEISSLAPLIDAHQEDLMREKEEKQTGLEEQERKKQQHTFNLNSPLNLSQQKQQRQMPLMGKPATPRMGKPASIQPPVSRLYGRPLSGLTKTQMIDNRLTTTTLTGLSSNLGGSGGYPLTLAHGMPSSRPSFARPPAPKLEVKIETIQPMVISTPKLISITIDSKINFASICVRKTDEPIVLPKSPKKRRDFKKTVKSSYSMEEIPEPYRTKPNLSYLIMIQSVMKTRSHGMGLTLNEIYEAIKELYPFYKYCPDGWQFAISHSVRLNKAFKKQTKRVNEWTYGIDESFISERERVRREQQEEAAAKAKAAALRTEELKQKQRLEAQQALSHNIVGRDFASPYSSNMRIPQAQFMSQLHQKPSNSQKQKTIAELASEIRRDSSTSSKGPLYFKSQSTLQVNSSGELVKRNDIPASISGTSTLPVNIKAQLAANRSQSSSQSPPSITQTNRQIFDPQRTASPRISSSKSHTTPALSLSSHVPGVQSQTLPPPSTSPSATVPQTINTTIQQSLNSKSEASREASPSSNAVPASKTSPNSTAIQSSPTISNSISTIQSISKSSQGMSMTQDTKKSLAYLQKELFNLYKARKLSYDTATTTEVITKALATTIAQVNVIGAKAGCGDNALSFLVDQAPQQVSKILDIALTKSIREKQPSSLSSRASTPISAARLRSPPPTPLESSTASGGKSDNGYNHSSNNVPRSTLQKPLLFSSAKPSSFKSDNSRSTNYSLLSKPQSLSKPKSLSNPPQFLSNKPSRPGFGKPPSVSTLSANSFDKSPTRPLNGPPSDVSIAMNTNESTIPTKRELTKDEYESPKKVMKQEEN